VSRVHVIAEAGNNHNGDPATASELIGVAAAAGADSVKFQIIYPEGLYLPAFPRDGGYEENEVIAQRRKFMLADDDYRRLAAEAAERGIAFSASVFDRRGLDLLDSLDPAYLKVASCDLNNVAFVREVAERGRKVVLSTGMSTLEEVKRTVDAALSTGNEDLVLLHCVSVYPATLEQMRLSFLDELREAFGLPIGLSDHTPTSTAAAMAIAKGATWIEKHFTLDKTQEGFDHAYALEPDELRAFVADLRAAERALATDGEKIGPAEREVMKRARRAIYAATDLEEGTVLSADDLLVVRPEGPLDAAHLDEVVGRRLARPLRRYEALTWEALA
jgi:sialic acid synthase SpsE